MASFEGGHEDNYGGLWEQHDGPENFADGPGNQDERTQSWNIPEGRVYELLEDELRFGARHGVVEEIDNDPTLAGQTVTVESSGNRWSDERYDDDDFDNDPDDGPNVTTTVSHSVTFGSSGGTLFSNGVRIGADGQPVEGEDPDRYKDASIVIEVGGDGGTKVYRVVPPTEGPEAQDQPEK